jgi:hypothetical protein
VRFLIDGERVPGNTSIGWVREELSDEYVDVVLPQMGGGYYDSTDVPNDLSPRRRSYVSHLLAAANAIVEGIDTVPDSFVGSPERQQQQGQQQHPDQQRRDTCQQQVKKVKTPLPTYVQARQMIADLPEDTMQLIRSSKGYRAWDKNLRQENFSKTGVYENPLLPGVPPRPWECDQYFQESGGVLCFDSWVGKRTDRLPSLPPKTPAASERFTRGSVAPRSTSDSHADSNAFLTPFLQARSKKGVMPSEDRCVSAEQPGSRTKYKRIMFCPSVKLRDQRKYMLDYDEWIRGCPRERRFVKGFFNDLAELLELHAVDKELVCGLGLQRKDGISQRKANNRALTVILDAVVSSTRGVACLGVDKSTMVSCSTLNSWKVIATLRTSTRRKRQWLKKRWVLNGLCSRPREGQ